LSYEDLWFYRSIARSRLRNDEVLRKKLEAERNQQAQRQSWTGWLWGSASSQKENALGKPMTNEQRKQLYEILDYDEKTALAESLQTPRDSLKTRLSMRLRRGSMCLTSDPHGQNSEITSVVFNNFEAKFTQRPDNFEFSISLGGLSVHDGTTRNTLYPEIVRVKDEFLQVEDPTFSSPQSDIDADSASFFYLKYENKPLDGRADNALTVRMRHMEIIYHREYIEAIYKFFKPPASHLESIEALLASVYD
jgi:vacuolar protein sorting-associated protein 13A/C